LNRIRDLEPAEPERRYERESPGKIIHIDIKKLGRFNRVGHRITGDPSAPNKSRGAGWDFVHVCIDDHSRVAFSEIKPDETANSAVPFLRAAVAYYKSLGVIVTRVMTDNGSCYQSFAFRDSSTSARSPIRLEQTARPSASSKPQFGNGLTPEPIRHQIGAHKSCRSGCINTTGTGHTVV
jgi:hypothetical protein